MSTQLKLIKWQGVKNSDTGKVTNGYLYIEFQEDCTLLNINPNVIGAKPVSYGKGQTIGFGIRASNRKEAINKFNNDYQFQ